MGQTGRNTIEEVTGVMEQAGKHKPEEMPEALDQAERDKTEQVTEVLEQMGSDKTENMPEAVVQVATKMKRYLQLRGRQNQAMLKRSRDPQCRRQEETELKLCLQP